jgi:hypothetical protein
LIKMADESLSIVINGGLPGASAAAALFVLMFMLEEFAAPSSFVGELVDAAVPTADSAFVSAAAADEDGDVGPPPPLLDVSLALAELDLAPLLLVFDVLAAEPE